MVNKESVQKITAPYKGLALFRQTLAKANTKDLVRVFQQFVTFNASFGGGVSSLAGNVANSALFGADTAKIAAHIFAAAIDEFHDSKFGQPHTLLAQAALLAVSEACGTRPPEDSTQNWEKAISEGYGQYLPKPDKFGLLRMIGFHMGSELLAAKEFAILNHELRKRFPELLTDPRYGWITIHAGSTGVEEEHFQAALAAAKMAARNEPEQAHIASGLRSFCQLQQDFMTSL